MASGGARGGKRPACVVCDVPGGGCHKGWCPFAGRGRRNSNMAFNGVYDPKLFEGEEALSGPGLDEYRVREAIEEEFGEDSLTHGFL